MVDVLLLLIQSNDDITRASFVESVKSSHYLRTSAELRPDQQTNSFFNNQRPVSVNSNYDALSNNKNLMNSQMSHQPHNLHNISEIRSDLQLEWMSQEHRICHCAMNQLSHLIIQKRKEFQTYLCYNFP